MDRYPKLINDTTQAKWVFKVRAHTRQLLSCLLTPFPLEENSNRELNCTLTGEPPDLLLTVSLHEEEDAVGGSWALSLRNQIGFSDTLVFSTHSREYTYHYYLNELNIIKFDKFDAS